MARELVNQMISFFTLSHMLLARPCLSKSPHCKNITLDNGCKVMVEVEETKQEVETSREKRGDQH